MISSRHARGRELTAYSAAAGPRRFAFPFTSRYVSMTLPPARAGSYLLLDASRGPIYIGRSDNCIRRRLLTHPLRGRATHFTAAVTNDARGAYLLECYWFHRYRDEGIRLTNQIHPASWRAKTMCLFCNTANFHSAAA